ncbi:MAG: thrombospondin type 3 repeat-containing protein [Candidatus Bathyarchaeia archaeon]
MAAFMFFFAGYQVTRQIDKDTPQGFQTLKRFTSFLPYPADNKKEITLRRGSNYGSSPGAVNRLLRRYRSSNMAPCDKSGAFNATCSLKGGYTTRSPAIRWADLLRALLIILPLLLWTHSPPEQAGAIPEYSRDLPSELKNFCNVCHERASGGPLNAFGTDYGKSGRNMGAISALDSDGDGYTNGDELAAGSFPGDPDSYPAAPRKTFNMVMVLASIGSLVLAAALIYKIRRG